MAIPRPSAARLAPLTDDELDDQQRELLGGGNAVGARAVNIFRTFVRHPGLYRKWLPLGGKLLAGKIPARDRELLILRTGYLCQSPYEWGQHVLIGKAAGITDTEIAAVATGPGDPSWSDWDRLLLTAADELHTEHCLSDATWAALGTVYDEKQLIEVPFLVGHYHLVAMTLNTLGVQRDEGVPDLP